MRRPCVDFFYIVFIDFIAMAFMISCAPTAQPQRPRPNSSAHLTALHFVRHQNAEPVIDVHVGEVWTSQKRFGQITFNPWTIFHLRGVTAVIGQNPALPKRPDANATPGPTQTRPPSPMSDWREWIAQLAAMGGGLPMEIQANDVDVAVGDWCPTPFRLRAARAHVTYQGVEFKGGVRIDTPDRVLEGRAARFSANRSKLVFDSGEEFIFLLPDLPIPQNENRQRIHGRTL